MKLVKLLLMITMALSVSYVLVAQVTQNEPRPAQQKMDDDRIEGAHAPIFAPPNTAQEASRLTEAASSALPADPASYAPVPRKNFVDEFIFGKIERDKIPHAPVSTDSEYLRRA
jgi:hypothetical protein